MGELKKPEDLWMATIEESDPAFLARVGKYVEIRACDRGGPDNVGELCDPMRLNADNCAALAEWLHRATAWLNRAKEG